MSEPPRLTAAERIILMTVMEQLKAEQRASEALAERHKKNKDEKKQEALSWRQAMKQDAGLIESLCKAHASGSHRGNFLRSCPLCLAGTP